MNRNLELLARCFDIHGLLSNISGGCWGTSSLRREVFRNGKLVVGYKPLPWDTLMQRISWKHFQIITSSKSHWLTKVNVQSNSKNA